MKWLLISFLLTFAGFISAQVNFQVSYNLSTRLAKNHKEYCNSFSVEATYKNFMLSSSYGRENWQFKNTSLFIPDSVNYPKSNANKLEFFCGYEFPLKRDQLKIAFSYGFRTYFRNEVEKKLSFIEYSKDRPISDDFILSNLNRDRILHSYPSYEINSTYANISQMRYAHLLKINVRYAYKNICFSVFYLPNLIHFTYETPLEPKAYGSNYLLFHDIGIGLSYTFSSKSKNQN